MDTENRAATIADPAQAAPNIPLAVPHLAGNEWNYVKECLDTGWVSSVGPFVTRFEQMLAKRVGTAEAVAATSGTAALHLALTVAGHQPDDEILVPALTFIAPANAVRYVGAWPVFVDVEPEFWEMDVGRAIEFLDKCCSWRNHSLVNRETGRRVVGILPVHLLGHPVDMTPLLEKARKYQLSVIEDATESLGAHYKGVSVGKLGDAACFSFNGNKIITTGGGGMFTSDNTTWCGRARYLSTQAKDDEVEYVHCQVGFNYRLTNVQAALGCAQLERLDLCIAAKRRIAAEYERLLTDIPGIRPMRQAPWAFSTFWLYTVLVDETSYGLSSRELMRKLAAAGVQSRPLWQPLHLSPAHARGFALGGEVAEDLYRRALSLPCSVGLRQEEVARVAELIRGFRRSAQIAVTTEVTRG
jgi:perosamine synthetase